MAMSEASLSIIIRATDEASGILADFEEQVEAATASVSDMMAELLASTQMLQAQMGNFQAQTANVTENVTGLNNNMTDSTYEATDAFGEAGTAAVGTAGNMGTLNDTINEAATPLETLATDLTIATTGTNNLAEGGAAADEVLQNVATQTTAAAGGAQTLGANMETAATETDEALAGVYELSKKLPYKMTNYRDAETSNVNHQA